MTKASKALRRRTRVVDEIADHARLFRYVERVFAASGNTTWPPVRQVARALRWRQARVEAACESDPDGRCFLSGYNLATMGPDGEEVLGELVVESFGDEGVSGRPARAKAV